MRERLLGSDHDIVTADGDMDEPSLFAGTPIPLTALETVAIGSAALFIVVLIAYKLLSHKFKKPSTTEPLLPTSTRR